MKGDVAATHVKSFAMQLHNRLSAKESADLIDREGQRRVVLSFYKYHHIHNTAVFRDHLFMAWDALNVLGRIYIAHEGINAQLSVPANALEAFKSHLNTISFLEGIRLNTAIQHYDKSFLKLKIKIRDKIVADGLDDAVFDVTDTGTHLNAKAFNDITAQEDTILIDMRNHYESEIGHFRNAITPDVDTFRESLPLISNELIKDREQDKNVVLYCTGGIRCEKAGAYFKQKGFKNVYQLEGGIIEYVRQVEEQQLENKFIGKNFVFDDRLSERVSDDVIARCHQCGKPCDTHVNCANVQCNLLFIQCADCQSKMEKCCSTECQSVIHLPEAEQRKQRKGKTMSSKIFKKGRSEALNYRRQSLRQVENQPAQ